MNIVTIPVFLSHFFPLFVPYSYSSVDIKMYYISGSTLFAHTVSGSWEQCQLLRRQAYSLNLQISKLDDQ